MPFREAGTSGATEIPAIKIRLPKGTAVRLFLMEPISIRTAKAGASVKLQVLGPVQLDNLVVIANTGQFAPLALSYSCHTPC